MHDPKPTLPPPRVMAAFREPACLGPHRRLSFGQAARLAVEMAEEMIAARASFPRGQCEPPAGVRRALRQPRR
jgi:hypothetical protein